MKRSKYPSVQTHLYLLAAFVEIAICWVCCVGASASAQWWDVLPRMIDAKTPQVAVDYHASMAMNGVGTDPGWGLWFMHSSANGQKRTRESFDKVGVRSISYNEGFGDSYAPITETGPGKPATILHEFWDWQHYSGGTVRWAGAWTWFDDADFARPYTRTNPAFGGQPMTYPDGTVASGFVDNDSSDPRKSRVYDAGSSKDILGHLATVNRYNAEVSANGTDHTGFLHIVEDDNYTGLVLLHKDTACPHWADYEGASTRCAIAETGLEGTWTDNIDFWDSFRAWPVQAAFGEWSVAGFRAYLRSHFTVSQLSGWGVIPPGGSYDDLNSFDVRAYLRGLASSKYGWDGANVGSAAWKKPGWTDEPVWRAYIIYKRQTGTRALADYCGAVKAAAAAEGKPDFFMMGNGGGPVSLGWMRGSLEMYSSELSLGWDLSSGSRGFGLPPFARVSPVYKSIREAQSSRFVNIWLYNNGFVDQLKLDPVINSIYYEMLATDTMPKLSPGDSEYPGNPSANKAFFQFVEQKAQPEFRGRRPVEDVGVYVSTSSILSRYTPGAVLNFDAQPHLHALWGWGTALSELHYQFRMVPEWKLNQDVLRTLKVLIIPNANVFDPADVAALDSWVRNDGGILIVTGDSGSRLGESANFETADSLTLSPLTGVSSYNSAPSSTVKTIGRGKVRYLKDNIGLKFFQAAPPARQDQLGTFAAELSTLLAAQNQRVCLASANAPATAGLTLYEDAAAGKLIVDLNDMNVSIASDGKSAAITPTPAIDVTLYKPNWWNTDDNELVAYAVSPDGSVALPKPVVLADRINLTIPPTNYYTSVVLTHAQRGKSINTATRVGKLLEPKT